MAIGATVSSGGIQLVSGHATASGTTVSSGGIEILFGGTTSATVLTSFGQEVVSSGGTANATVISDDDLLVVLSGGVISGATIAGGILHVASGGAALSSTVTFAGSGSLVLDDTKFRGKIAGLYLPDETIDLKSVSFASATLGYTGNSLNGTPPSPTARTRQGSPCWATTWRPTST